MVAFFPRGEFFPEATVSRTASTIVADRDAWGRTRGNGSTVNISTDGTPGNTAHLNRIDGQWFGSSHTKWNNPTQGHIPRFNNYVQDGTTAVTPPALKAFTNTGYYAQKATDNGVFLDYTTSGKPWAVQKTFRNSAERRDVAYIEVDIALLRSSNNGADWPKNGAIYSDVPIALINADNLSKPPELVDDPEVPNGLTVVSDSTIYTRGDFNMNYPTPLHLLKSNDTAFFNDFYTAAGRNPNDPDNQQIATANPALYQPAAFAAALDIDTRLGTAGADAGQITRLKRNNIDMLQPPFREEVDSGGNPTGRLVPNPGSIYAPERVNPASNGSAFRLDAYKNEYENRHSTALMTNDRIYHTTEEFAFPNNQYSRGGAPNNNENRKFPTDENQVLGSIRLWSMDR